MSDITETPLVLEHSLTLYHHDEIIKSLIKRIEDLEFIIHERVHKPSIESVLNKTDTSYTLKGPYKVNIRRIVKDNL